MPVHFRDGDEIMLLGADGNIDVCRARQLPNGFWVLLHLRTISRRTSHGQADIAAKEEAA